MRRASWEALSFAREVELLDAGHVHLELDRVLELALIDIVACLSRRR